MSKLSMEHFERLFMTGQLDGNTDDSGNGDGGDKGDAPTVEELQRDLASMTKERDAVKNNRDEILAEKKKNGKEKLEAEEQALQAKAAKAQNDKDFESFKKSHDEITAKNKKEFDAERAEFNQSRVEAESTKIAARLADGFNVEILSGLMRQRIRFENGSMVVLDVNGKVTAHTLTDLENEFKNSENYASLLKGRKSSGGGANGGSGGAGGEAKEITRSELNTLTPVQQKAHFKTGGTVTDG